MNPFHLKLDHFKLILFKFLLKIKSVHDLISILVSDFLL